MWEGCTGDGLKQDGACEVGTCGASLVSPLWGLCDDFDTVLWEDWCLSHNLATPEVDIVTVIVKELNPNSHPSLLSLSSPHLPITPSTQRACSAEGWWTDRSGLGRHLPDQF